MPDSSTSAGPPTGKARLTLPLALIGALAVLGGVIAMQQPDGAIPLGLAVPGWLRDVFPNAQSILAGTVIALSGLLLAGLFLPANPPLPHALHVDGAWSTPHFHVTLTATRGAVLAASGMLYAVALISAHARAMHPILLLAFIAALLLLVAAVATRPRAAIMGAVSQYNRWELAAVAAAILAFIALIVPDLTDWHFAYWGDEWPFYSLAHAIANGQMVDPFSQAGVYGFHPIADSIYQALVMRVGGMGATAWRVSSVLATALPIAAIYALGRALGGKLFGAAAMALYAICPLLWAFAHIGYNNDDPLLPAIVAVACCYVGARAGSAALLFASGLCAGICWYSIFTGRLAIGVIVALLLTEWHGGRRAWTWRLALVLAGFAIAVLPLAIDNGYDTLGVMSHNTPLSTTHNMAEYLHLVGRNAIRAVYAFTYSTADDHYTIGAIFDPLAAAALLVGIAVALRRILSFEARLMLIWFFATLALTTPFNDAEGVSLTRSMVVVPAAALLAALGFCSFWHAALRLARLRGMWPLAIALTLSLAVSLGLNLRTRYVTMPQNFYPPYPQMVLLLKAMRANPDAAFILPPTMGSIEPNYQFCQVVQGYNLPAGSIFVPNGVTLTLYCPQNTVRVMPRTSVILFRGTEAAAASCHGVPFLVDRLTQGTIWSFRLALPMEPSASYLTRLTAAVLRLCPSLYTD